MNMKWTAWVVVILLVCTITPSSRASWIFEIKYTPTSFAFSSPPSWFHPYTYPVSATTFYIADATSTTRTLSFADLYFSRSGTGDIGTAVAKASVQVTAVGRPSSGTVNGSFNSFFWANNVCPDKIMIAGGSYSGTVTFTGGSGSIAMQFDPEMPGTNWYIPSGHRFKMKLTTAFYLTDPSLSLGASGIRANTSRHGGGASSAMTFTMSQTADAFVDSLVLNHGDGTQASVPVNQLASLKFTATGSHAYTLGEGIDSRTYAAGATAYGPSDASSDLDRSASSTNVTVLRSPLAGLALDGNLVEAGSVLEVEVGQLLSFHGASAIGFIEEALLKLDGSQVMRTTSASGFADESLFGALTIPELSFGSDLLLEYMCSNTGSGLNSSTWSATLHVVPEPVTLSLLVMASALLLRRRRLASS